MRTRLIPGPGAVRARRRQLRARRRPRFVDVDKMGDGRQENAVEDHIYVGRSMEAAI